MKFLVYGDLHGYLPTKPTVAVDAIISPGDFCSESLTKIFFKFIRMRKKGFDGAWWDIEGKTKTKQMIREACIHGRAVLERLNSFGLPVYIIPGNHDWTGDKESKWSFLRTDFYKELLKGLKNIHNCHNKLVPLETVAIVGYGESSGPEIAEDCTMQEWNAYVRKVSKYIRLCEKTTLPVLFLCHNPPHGKLDTVMMKSSPAYGRHVGSTLARDVIEEVQPLMCICGHMHEHYGRIKLGKTTILNAGYKKNASILYIKNGKTRLILDK